MHFSMKALCVTALSLQAIALPAPEVALEVSSSSVKTIEKRYAAGRCGVHVTQYQKNEGPNGPSGESPFHADIISLLFIHRPRNWTFGFRYIQSVTVTLDPVVSLPVAYTDSLFIARRNYVLPHRHGPI